MRVFFSVFEVRKSSTFFFWPFYRAIGEFLVDAIIAGTVAQGVKSLHGGEDLNIISIKREVLSQPNSSGQRTLRVTTRSSRLTGVVNLENSDDRPVVVSKLR